MARIAESFFGHAAQAPDKQAVWCEDATVTYGELAGIVERWSALLSRDGVCHGDHVGIILENSIAFVAMMLVASRLGLVLVPVSTSAPVRGVATLFDSARVRHLVTSRRWLTFAGHEPDFLVEGLVATVDEAADGCLYLGDERFCHEEPPVLPEAADDAPYIFTMTSGSTGEPKPIILSQATKYERALSAIELYRISSSDRILAATPLYHSLAERLAIVAMISGATLVLKARFSPEQWLEALASQAVTFTIAVSSQLKQVAERLGNRSGETFPHLRCVVSSSALLEPDIKRLLVRQLNCEFHECYGASEVAIVTNLDPAGARDHVESVGKAIPGVELRILDDEGREIPVGEVGEIACRTPLAFSGYFGRPDVTADAFRHDFFLTGDLGKLDEEGFLYFMGRKKEVIISGGINIYPQDIENVLRDHEGIVDAVAFPLDDDSLGEVVGVALVTDGGAEVPARALRRYCAENLADYQIPRAFFYIDSVPVNGMGKVMRSRAREMALAVTEEREKRCA